MTDIVCSTCNNVFISITGESSACFGSDISISCLKCGSQYVFDQKLKNKKKFNYYGMRAEIREDGFCYLENGRIIDPDH